jgi:2-polyprenyl-6-methoxyphenol hydroxylase-like FAD-dependent oxidoreductase
MYLYICAYIYAHVCLYTFVFMSAYLGLKCVIYYIIQVVHLPQNKFEIILREEVNKNVSTGTCDLLLGYEAKDLNFTADGTNIVLKKSTYKKSIDTSNDQIELNCDYLVAADGANSLVRRSLDIDLHGQVSSSNTYTYTSMHLCICIHM